MVLYPEVQKKAQSELDAVVGPDRLPDFTDRDKLPYVNALVKELHRWCPVTPLAVAHGVTQDDVYRGYHIPNGSIVTANVWCVVAKQASWPRPELTSFNAGPYYMIQRYTGLM